MVASFSTFVVWALRSGPLPRALPPTRAVPPPLLPETSIFALPVRATSLPVTTTLPPFCPPVAAMRPEERTLPSVSMRTLPPSATADEASTVPVLTISTPEPAPLKTILPPFSSADAAETSPLFTTEPTIPSSCAAVSTTTPPSALMEPLFSTPASGVPSTACRVSTSFSSTVKVIRSSPCISSFQVLSPEARATFASLPAITPSLRTVGATRAAKPFSLTLIVP